MLSEPEKDSKSGLVWCHSESGRNRTDSSVLCEPGCFGVTAERPVGQEWNPHLVRQLDEALGGALAIDDAQLVLNCFDVEVPFRLPHFRNRGVGQAEVDNETFLLQLGQCA